MNYKVIYNDISCIIYIYEFLHHLQSGSSSSGGSSGGSLSGSSGSSSCSNGGPSWSRGSSRQRVYNIASGHDWGAYEYL